MRLLCDSPFDLLFPELTIMVALELRRSASSSEAPCSAGFAEMRLLREGRRFTERLRLCDTSRNEHEGVPVPDGRGARSR